MTRTPLANKLFGGWGALPGSADRQGLPLATLGELTINQPGTLNPRSPLGLEL